MTATLLQLTKLLSWADGGIVRDVYNLQWSQDLLKYIEQKSFLSPVRMKLTDALEIEVIGIFDVNLLKM